MTRRKLLNALLAVATFAVVWLVVSPASAMAPVCDPRGAIGFAPPPQIQNAELSLDVPADCVDVNPLETKNIVPGHLSPSFDFSSSQDPAASSTVMFTMLVFAERLPIHADEQARPPPGICTSLERPPRL